MYLRARNRGPSFVQNCVKQNLHPGLVVTHGILPGVEKPVALVGVAEKGKVTLEFTITSLIATVGATGLAFTDDLDAVVPGLAAVGLPASDICGTGSAISGTIFLTFTGGSLPVGGSCTFSLTLQVPFDATPGVFPNITSDLTGTITGASAGIIVRGAAAPPAMGAQDDLAIIPPPGWVRDPHCQ